MAPERKKFYYKKKKKPEQSNTGSNQTEQANSINSSISNNLSNPYESKDLINPVSPVKLTSPESSDIKNNEINQGWNSVDLKIESENQDSKIQNTPVVTNPVIAAKTPVVTNTANLTTVSKVQNPKVQSPPTANPVIHKKIHHKPRLREGNSELQNSVKPVHSNQTISVVIPLLNEADSLTELSAALEKVFASMRCNYEVIFIDDGSTDRSFSKIKEISRRNNKFHCIKLRRNYGKSAALSKGFKAAKGGIVITMDADLQDDPTEIPELVKVLNSGYDLVSGWKKVRYDPFIKKHTSKLFNYVTSKLSGVKLHDFNCGLKAYKSDVVKSISMYGEMHRYIPALAYMAGFKVTEKPVKHHARKYGVTKFGASRFVNGFLDLLTVVFTNKYIKRPLHFFGSLGIITSFIGFLISLYLIILKLAEGKPLSDRPLFLVGIFFIIIGVQFLSLGLIAEMITKSNVKDDDILVEQSF